MILWSLEDTTKVIHTFEGHTRPVGKVLHIPDTQYIVSVSGDKTLRIWNYQTY